PPPPLLFPYTTLFRSYLLGIAFAFGWTPCIGPILGGILTMSASSAGAVNGIALLSVYSLGMGVPFLLTALFIGRFLSHMKHMGRDRKSTRLNSSHVSI